MAPSEGPLGVSLIHPPASVSHLITHSIQNYLSLSSKTNEREAAEPSNWDCKVQHVAPRSVWVVLKTLITTQSPSF